MIFTHTQLHGSFSKAELYNYLDITDYQDIARLIMIGLFIEILVNSCKLLVYQRISDSVNFPTIWEKH